MGRRSNIWPPERVERLIELFDQGLSNGKIAKILGTKTNSVAGKVRYLGLVAASEDGHVGVWSSKTRQAMCDTFLDDLRAHHVQPAAITAAPERCVPLRLSGISSFSSGIGSSAAMCTDVVATMSPSRVLTKAGA
jgi:hypothetical protein